MCCAGVGYGRVLAIGPNLAQGDEMNRASKLGEDLAVKAETLITDRAVDHSSFEVPELAERMTARISDIEIEYIRIPMTEASR